jgi:carboxypeptidase T
VRRAETKRILPWLLLALLAGSSFTVCLHVVQAASDHHRLVEVQLGGKTQCDQLAAMGLDIIAVGSSCMKAYVTDEQVSRLEGMGLTTKEVPLSEVIDESVVGKTGAGVYHTYAETTAELHQIELAHSDVAKVYKIGQSIEGRDILALKISDKPAVEEPSEPEVLYMGCHHAREWISVEMPLHLANYLVNNYGTDPNITRLVNERQTWIVPIVNPDGLEYSQTAYTMWRKNKRDNNNNGAFDPSYDGVDINRNYGYKWGYDNIGSSPNPTNEVYRGDHAFSEPETQAIRSLALQHHFVFSISYHSYGELMIYPWGYKNADTTDDKLFTDVATRMSGFNSYIYGNPKDGVIYNTNGDSDDWLYGDRNTIAYTFEVGTMFIPPESQIESIWQKNKYASLYLLQLADNPYQIYPSIKMYTDKTEYSKNETMRLGLNLINPNGAANVGVGVWVDMPSGAKYWVVQEPNVNIPKNFNYSNPAWKTYTLPTLEPGNYSWHAMVVDSSTYHVLSESIAKWSFKSASFLLDLAVPEHRNQISN